MDTKSPQRSVPEIWGGVECTINRVENTYYDQLSKNGFYERSTDLVEIGKLNVRAMRFPVLWEKHQAQPDVLPDFTWAGEQLQLMKEMGIKPIVGLLHHGSGPSFTDLEDERFPYLLAAYAKQVANAFPWVTDYTPVNEPLTTARFSGLYGFWYPHKQQDVSFAIMLLNQLKGTVLSMRAIREVNPAARLIQTEDLGKVYSTPLLQYQATFENERRWLTYDILSGKCTDQHPLWAYFKRLGIKTEDLEFFIDNPCPPDMLGINYYITSERYLDENISVYPAHTIGSNEIHAYADVEAIRINHKQPWGFSSLVKECWNRYQAPIAITEVHLGCTQDEQARWFKEKWEESIQLLNSGVNIQAVTAWAMTGSYDWNTLLTQNNHHYECGVFDTRNGRLEPTLLTRLIKALACNTQFNHPLLKQKGWWHQPERFLFTYNTEITKSVLVV